MEVCMGLTRTWTVFGFAEDVPVLIARCATQESAVKLADNYAKANGADYHVVEQLLPADALVLWFDERVQSTP
jgi:hypothetical protein